MCSFVNINGIILLVYLQFFYRNKKREILSRKTKIMWKAQLRCHTLLIFFVSLGVIFIATTESSQQPPFPFCIYLVMYILVYNVESYGYFQMGICRSLCHRKYEICSRGYIFPNKFYRKICFIENMLLNFISFLLFFFHIGSLE